MAQGKIHAHCLFLTSPSVANASQHSLDTLSIYLIPRPAVPEDPHPHHGKGPAERITPPIATQKSPRLTVVAELPSAFLPAHFMANVLK